MALYYLYVKYEYRQVYAFAIIWLVFIVAMLVGLTYTWQLRVKEQRILDAQLAAEEKAVQEHALHIEATKAENTTAAAAAVEEHKSA